MQINAVKTGIMLNCDIVEAVAQEVDRFGFNSLLVNPVIASRAGVQLIDDNAIAVLQKLLIPQATIITLNRYESKILSGLIISFRKFFKYWCGK